ncbi:MAG: FtsH protease activity modulator HflK [Alphaproteobacteria bacterium]|nr:FtsH protease activity modulator HflK [Alphaproteobacteria bacterium]
MPWQNQGGGGPWGGGGGSGGGGGPKTPWGRGPGGIQPPDLEGLLRKGQDRIRRIFPGGVGGARGVGFAVLIGVLLWFASGFYRVAPDEQGVVLRFGQWVRTATPGLNYHMPKPIESVLTPNVTRENRIEIGFRSADGSRAGPRREVQDEALMLTGDENIVDIKFVVFWRVKDAGQYVFNVRQPETTVKAAAESALRESVGQKPIQSVFTEGRAQIEQQTVELLQRLLDEYKAGIEIRQVQMLEVDPPSQVVDAFNEVQRARADKERLRNEADAYRNDVVPRARGEAERLIQEARAYREEVVARATGDASRFKSIYDAYKVNKDVTTQRIYLETLEEILKGAQKVVIDRQATGSGVLPYLPLPELRKKAEEKKP